VSGGAYEALRKRAADPAEALHREVVVAVRLMTQDWRPRFISDALPDHIPFSRESVTVMLSGIKFSRFDFTVLCAPDDREACDAVDVSDLMPEVIASRDPNTLATALSHQTRDEDGNAVLRDVLSEASLAREAILSRSSAERRFHIVWYDGRDVLVSK